MKTRFTTVDIVAIVRELQKCIGMRVNQIYDVDNKTYLIRLNRYEEKIVLLIESGVRIHTTDFQWPKNPSPSGFSMKMRKHIKNKRLEKLSQLGTDRIIDLQFGINDAAYHVILELYDRGNIVLTDFEYTILNILRPRMTGSEDVKFIVREKYPIDRASSVKECFNRDKICKVLNEAKDGDSLKKIIMPETAFGPALLDHVLFKNGFTKNCLINKEFKVPSDIHRLFLCLEEAEKLFWEISQSCKGYIFQKVESSSKNSQEITTNVDFHPYLFCQFFEMKYIEYASFDKAVDNFFSNMEGQKIDLKALQKEKEALKKLANVKKDHEQRLTKLHESQAEDIKKAQLIEMNTQLVDKAITIIRSAIANQMNWSDIQDIIKEAQLEGDPVAKSIKKLKLDINHFTLLLSNPIADSDDEDSKPQMIDIDIGCSAYANARKYYDLKRAHAKKEQKTIESSEKAFKNAERKTKQALKEVAVTTSITKARKVMWFEKFLWFISSENYLVIAGRDVQQNELLVKKYLKTKDLYVHADLHGASSVVIKNQSGNEVPPKTLIEAGTLSVCCSSAWDAKIVTSAWWVYSDQVSKTAPSGEYLTAGSFMIRGKKNFLPPCNLIMGFGFMFKLDDESISNHLNERCERSETESIYSEVCETTTTEETKSEVSNEVEVQDELEIANDTEDSNSSESDENSSSREIGTLEKLENNDIASEQIFNFPNTEVKLNVFTTSKTSSLSNNEKNSVEHAPAVVVKEHQRISKAYDVPKNITKDEPKEKMYVQKRGHKGKLKKIKEKYKYQDDEERDLKMKILASAGQSKDDKKSKKKQKNTVVKVSNLKERVPVNKTEVSNNVILEVKNSDIDTITDNSKEKCKPAELVSNAVENDVSDDEDENIVSEEIKLLNSLTGCPLPDDILLFAVPVCGPYSSLLNYKYKVKIIPGSNRRGKAAKTALQMFLHDKAATSRERDLLKSVKDQDISRNLPGKIKITAANLKKK